MRILICDDDLLIVEKLQKYLKSYFSHLHLSCPEIVCFSDGESLLADRETRISFFSISRCRGLTESM